MKLYDVIVIGRGPAGISGAIYALRGGLSVLVLSKDQGAAAKAEKIENYYGFAEPVTGPDLLAAGEAQAKRLGAQFVDAQVYHILKDEHFILATSAGEYKSRSVLMATGRARKKVAKLNIDEYEGRGVSYCAVCDAFFYRGREVAVLGSGDYAMNEARELVNVVSKVTVLTNGQPFEGTADPRVEINPSPVKKLLGDDRLTGVETEDGILGVDGLFIAVGTASALDIARTSGIVTEGDSISVNKKLSTNIPGLFAAGDCIGGLLQISTAVGEGAVASMGILEYLREAR